MPLYRITDDDEDLFVLAVTLDAALEQWRTVQQQIGNPIREPDRIDRLAHDHQIVTHPAWFAATAPASQANPCVDVYTSNGRWYAEYRTSDMTGQSYDLDNARTEAEAMERARMLLPGVRIHRGNP